MNFNPRGIIPAMVTPFTNSHEINESSLRKLLDHLIEGGVHGVFIISSTGESYAMSTKEKRRAIEITVDHVAGRVAVYAGTGCITTDETIELTNIAEDCGVDAVSLITPYFISPNQQELMDHYKKIAENTKLPILLYNNVGRTNVNLEAKTVAELAKVPNIVGIKDSSGDMTLSSEYIRMTRGTKFSTLIGRDTLIYGGLCYGASGAIAACANVAPRLCVEIYDKFNAGDLKGSLDCQYALAPLRLSFNLGSFPVVIKEALTLQGIDMGTCISPIAPLDEAKRAQLKKILQDLNLL
jgi:4-hydroxy-tetrahydrodipicolinate synthase